MKKRSNRSTKVGIFIATAFLVPAVYGIVRYIRDLGDVIGSMVDIFKESWE